MRLGLLATAFLLGAAPAARAQQGDFRWTGPIAAGKRLEVKGVNGAVRAVAASGAQAEVVARKDSRRSDLESVEIKVIEHEGGVTICAVYPTPARARRDNICEPGDHWSSNNENNDVTADFDVKVPAGVLFLGRTVNGQMSATGLTADVSATTVNGSVRVTTTGLAEASTVNGSVYVEMGRADWDNELDFSTVNGAITLVLPATLNTEVRASTVNGGIETDYPLTVSGRFGPRSVRGTIGTGGRSLHLKTVNGEITLKRAM